MAAVPITLDFEVLPSALPDLVTTRLYYRLPKDSKTARAVSEALGCVDSPSTPGEVVIAWRWIKLMVSAASHFDINSVGAMVPFLCPHDPGWVATLLAQLEVDGVFDTPFQSAAKIMVALSAWRERALAGGGLPAAATVDAAALTTVALDIDATSFDPNFIPWPAELTFAQFGDPDAFPLYTMLDDLGEASVFSQVATDRFWYTCERVLEWVRTYLSFQAATPSFVLIEALPEFMKATRWTHAMT